MQTNKSHETSPKIEKETWLGLAIASIFVGLFLVGWAGFHVFFVLEDNASREQFSRILPPFFAVIGAIITFLTVAWRGAIANEQLLAQQQQINIAERVNIAGVFKSGLELLHSERAADQYAGIKTLAIVVELNDVPFVHAALEALEAYYINILRKGDVIREREIAQSIADACALAELHPLERRDWGTVYNTLEDGSIIFEKQIQWWNELPVAEYEEFHFFMMEHPRKEGPSFARCSFMWTRTFDYHYNSISVGNQFRACEFSYFKVAAMDSEIFNTFKQCDFSGAKIYLKNLHERQFENCSYFSDSVPELFDNGEPVSTSLVERRLKKLGIVKMTRKREYKPI